ncbi:MAG: hypothetical protein Q8L60_16585 [Gammaproteobacteria bacterium]|nr:hypothetical protein [Gammaproteobacteria bacterium]MDP2141244.1 hypothetical protein [Gammaproteobacteria bacterium]MDP2349082.1 hypothetical protein [Gammaproteobacteria bacterium]
MKDWLIGMVCSLLPLTVLAEPALFLDNVLSIDEGIVVQGGETRYYSNIRLALTPNGDFQAIAAETKNLVHLDEISVAVIETNPVQVELEVVGSRSNPCIDVDTIVKRKGNHFFVVLTETPLQTLVACAQVIDPYQDTIPLDVKDLPAGNYQVLVNGMEIDFDLD